MAVKKFASDIIKKSVMTVDGELIGTVNNVVVDTELGMIKSVLVKPQGGNKYTEFQIDKEGRYMIPLKAMKSMKDVFVVDVSSDQKLRN